MGFQNLIAYQKRFQLARDIFELYKSFPKEEQYSLTDQIRRSSRTRKIKERKAVILYDSESEYFRRIDNRLIFKIQKEVINKRHFSVPATEDCNC